MTLIGDISTNNARRYPDKRALVDADRVHTWSQVDERARRLAGYMAGRGLEPGDRVMVIARNCIEWPEISFGLAKAGLIAVPVNIRLAPDEVAHARDDCGARAVIVHADHLDRFLGELSELALILGIGAQATIVASELVTDYETALAHAQPSAGSRSPGPSPDDVAVILYTSGTTGRAKGVMHTHRALLYQAADTNLVTEANRSDVMLATTPFFTAGGMVRTVSWLYLGQTMVIHQRFDPQAVVDEIERSGITFTTFIPTMLHRTLAILEDGPPRDMSSLRRISYGSAPVPPGLARKAMDLLGCDLQQRYGLTECGGQATILTPQDHRDILAGKTSIATSCGQETPMCAIRVITPDGNDAPVGDVGEIVIVSPANSIGYWNQPEKTAETFRPDGLRSGDLGYLDADGYLHITGRRTDLIISGGFNVYPAEIERVIAQHPGVDMVAVVGVRDPEWGETPVAVVIPKSHVHDQDALTDELLAACRDGLAGYKQPRRFVYWQEFPLGPAGKILKREIANQVNQVDDADGEDAGIHRINRGAAVTSHTDLATIEFSVTDHVATVALNRPERLNSFTEQMAADLTTAWGRVRDDDDIHVAVLCANGERAFCTGIDVTEGTWWTHKPIFNQEDPGEMLGPKAHKVWKPVIAALHGIVAGGAMYFVNECDFSICSETATFFDPHANAGIVSARQEPIGMLALGVPYGEVMRWALLGSEERMTAQTALRVGIVTEVVPDDELRPRAFELAAEIAARRPNGIQGTVRAMWEARDKTPTQAARNGKFYTDLGNAGATPDSLNNKKKPRTR